MLSEDKFHYFSMKLVNETHLSGEYLYNAYIDLYNIDESILSENNLTMILLNLSMGIERLMKVLVLLSNEIQLGNEHDISKSLEETKSMGHNLTALRRKIEVDTKNEFSNKESLVLTMISEIYEKERYTHTDRKELGHRIEKVNKKFRRLEWEEINIDEYGMARISKRTKNNFLDTLDSIIKQLMELLGKLSSKLNVYTYEAESTSKFYIFNYSKKPSLYFYRRKLAIKELFFILAEKGKTDEETLENWGIVPLDIDESMIPFYIIDLIDNATLSDLVDEVESAYFEIYEIESSAYDNLFIKSINDQEEPEDEFSKRINMLYNIPIDYLIDKHNF